MYSIIVSPFVLEGEKEYYKVYTPEQAGELIKNLAERMGSNQRITILIVDEKPE